MAHVPNTNANHDARGRFTAGNKAGRENPHHRRVAELRVFIASVDHLLQARHQLHKAIDREFRQAGLEIAFPQRDIHIRTVTPVVRLEQDRRQRDRTVAADAPTAERESDEATKRRSDEGIR